MILNTGISETESRTENVKNYKKTKWTVNKNNTVFMKAKNRGFGI